MNQSLRILNLPNFITITRILAIPMFIALLITDSTFMRTISLVLFIAIALSDLLDGYVARRLNQSTEFGKFLDPVADKLLVISTLTAFIILDPLIPPYMVIMIFSRDLLITVMRVKAIKNGFSIQTSKFAKWKTTFQFIVIILILIILITRVYIKDIETNKNPSPIENSILSSLQDISKYINIRTKEKNTLNLILKHHRFAHHVPYFLVLFITLLTLLSLFHYLWLNKKIIKKILQVEFKKYK